MALVVQEAAETSFSAPVSVSWLMPATMVASTSLTAGAGVRQQQARAAGVDESGQFARVTVASGGIRPAGRCPPASRRLPASGMADGDARWPSISSWLNFDRPGKAAVRRVEAGQVGHALQIGRLVDGDYLQAVRGHRRFQQRAQEAAADAAVAVDGKTEWLWST
jgi:hypothetical protein